MITDITMLTVSQRADLESIECTDWSIERIGHAATWENSHGRLRDVQSCTKRVNKCECSTASQITDHLAVNHHKETMYPHLLQWSSPLHNSAKSRIGPNH